MKQHEIYELAIDLFHEMRHKFPEITDVTVGPRMDGLTYTFDFKGLDTEWSCQLYLGYQSPCVTLYYPVEGELSHMVDSKDDIYPLEYKIDAKEYKVGKALSDLLVQRALIL